MQCTKHCLSEQLHLTMHRTIGLTDCIRLSGNRLLAYQTIKTNGQTD